MDKYKMLVFNDLYLISFRNPMIIRDVFIITKLTKPRLFIKYNNKK